MNLEAALSHAVHNYKVAKVRVESTLFMQDATQKSIDLIIYYMQHGPQLLESHRVELAKMASDLPAFQEILVAAEDKMLKLQAQIQAARADRVVKKGSSRKAGEEIVV